MNIHAKFKKQNIVLNANPSVLYEYALKEEGTIIERSGALSTYSGEKTGRCPKDKRIVNNGEQDIWWDICSPNISLCENSFLINKENAINFMKTKKNIFIFNGFAGWNKTFRIKIRVICTRAYHSLFMNNMLIRPTSEELNNFGEPDFVIYNAGEIGCNINVPDMTSNVSVDINFKSKEMVILGTEYAGEMKKGVFTIMHYLMPKINILSLHSSVNQSFDKNSISIFFGLSGTGKTTLSADSNRLLIGDDEHCWYDDGIFNIEGGCYAKCINLSKEKEPEIYSAIKFGTVLENCVIDPKTREVDFDDDSITPNTRASYPIEFIENAKIPCVTGHPTNIILLTCDAFGIFPPVCKLDSKQLMYHFISGYTSKISGTEEGITEPEATFSACYGEAFIVHHPITYAKLLEEKVKKHNVNAWLINTGWQSGNYNNGKRISLKYTRTIVNAINNDEINCEYEKMPKFGLDIPLNIKGIPDKVLLPWKNWDCKSEYDKELLNLSKLFIENFKKYKIQHIEIMGGPNIN